MSTPTPSQATAAARDAARQANGEFGTQPVAESTDVWLVAEVAEGDPQPGIAPTQDLADKLPAWPEHLDAPTFVVDFSDDGEIVIQIYTGDRVATFWGEGFTDMPDAQEWEVENGEYDGVYAYGRMLSRELDFAYQESLQAPMGKVLLGHAMDRIQFGGPVISRDVRRFAEANDIAVAYQGRGQFEDRIGRTMTDEEWAVVKPHLADYDEWLTNSISQDSLTVWHDHVLDLAGFEYDDELNDHRIADLETSPTAD